MTLRIALIAVGLLAASCDKPEPDAASQAPQTVAETPPAETTGAAKTDAEVEAVWDAASVESLDDGQSAQLAKAKAAQKELGTTLMTALTDSVTKDGFAPSIEFCRGEAPDVAEKVAASHGLKIGRTSHKLRNPKNSAPEWAADAVAKAKPGMKVFNGPSGELGVLSPIELAPLCVNCHGAPDKLAEGVADAVKEKYPNDQATGFAPGDLRGWFWVEVPTS